MSFCNTRSYFFLEKEIAPIDTNHIKLVVFFGVPDGRALVLTGGKPQGQGCTWEHVDPEVRDESLFVFSLYFLDRFATVLVG
jgi:hypothetical protein